MTDWKGGVILAAALAAGLAPLRGAAAQGAPWNRTVEANANLLFGAAKGRVASLSAGAAKADSAVELRGEVRFTYADARDPQGVVSVTARASRLSLGADYRPYGRVSPFLFGTAESSLQQRVAHRYSGGLGAKIRILPPGDNEASVSLALLWEETRALHPAPGVDATVSLARWSFRLRANRRLSSAVQASHTTFYQPAADELGRFTAETTTGLAVALNSSLSLTVTLRDRYDSEAGSRGAASNHDGQLLFGVRAKF